MGYSSYMSQVWIFSLAKELVEKKGDSDPEIGRNYQLAKYTNSVVQGSKVRNMREMNILVIFESEEMADEWLRSDVQEGGASYKWFEI